MSEPSFPADLLREWRDFDRRLRALESAPRATNTSVDEGAFNVNDADGSEVAELGEFDEGSGIYGVRVRHPATGVVLLQADTDAGLASPYQPLPAVDPFDFRPITSATFVAVWWNVAEVISADAVKVRIGFGADASTPGEVRVVIANAAGATSAIALPAGTSGFVEFNWRHGMTLQAGPVYFQVEARRVSGAGNVNIYTPTAVLGGAEFLGATATGL